MTTVHATSGGNGASELVIFEDGEVLDDDVAAHARQQGQLFGFVLGRREAHPFEAST